jgi:hypothetical protein
MNDESWASLARMLADALIRYAKERGDAEKRVIAELNTEMCAARRAELEAPPETTPTTNV